MLCMSGKWLEMNPNQVTQPGQATAGGSAQLGAPSAHAQWPHRWPALTSQATSCSVWGNEFSVLPSTVQGLNRPSFPSGVCFLFWQLWIFYLRPERLADKRHMSHNGSLSFVNKPCPNGCRDFLWYWGTQLSLSQAHPCLSSCLSSVEFKTLKS